MELSPAQLTILKNNIAANTATIDVTGVPTQIKDVPHSPDLANRAHWRAKGRRAVLRGEFLFVTQTVGGPSQTGNRGTRTNPDTFGAEG